MFQLSSRRYGSKIERQSYCNQYIPPLLVYVILRMLVGNRRDVSLVVGIFGSPLCNTKKTVSFHFVTGYDIISTCDETILVIGCSTHTQLLHMHEFETCEYSCCVIIFLHAAVHIWHDCRDSEYLLQWGSSSSRRCKQASCSTEYPYQ